MNAGVSIAVLTGLLWTAVGVVMSGCSKNGVNFKVYYFWNSLFTALLAAAVYVDWGALGSGADGRFKEMALIIAASGLVTAFGLAVMQKAMPLGHNGAVWAIGQSALVLPFLFGVVFMGESGSFVKFAGVSLILVGMALPAFVKKGGSEGAASRGDGLLWFKLSVLALVVLGVGQILQSVPSYWKGWTDATGSRASLNCLGCAAGGAFCALFFKSSGFFDRKTLLLALGMAFVNVASVKLFFVSLDRLGACGAASLGFPVIVGSCIIGFSLYSLLALRERSGFLHWGGLAATVAGVVAISFR